MREALVNKISEDIVIEYETNWGDIERRVGEYASLLEDEMRNFYEMQMGTGPCPLFALCYYLGTGKDNFGFTDDEFQDELDKLEEKVNEKFNVDIRELGYGL
jgi:hypothetical protein